MKITLQSCFMIAGILIIAACDNDPKPCTHSGEQYYWEMDFDEDTISSHIQLDFCEWNRSNYYHFASQPDSSDVVDVQIGFSHIMDEINDEVLLNFEGVWKRSFLESLTDSELAEQFFRERSFIIEDNSLFTYPDRRICGPDELQSVPLNDSCPWIVNVSIRQQTLFSHELEVSQSLLQITELTELDSVNYVIEGTIEMYANSYYNSQWTINIRNGRFRVPIQVPTISQLLDRLEE